jgi:hypothetical protein
MIEEPTRIISYEIVSPNENENDERLVTLDREVARKSFEQGYLVTEHEIIKGIISTGQGITTIPTTEWRFAR